MGIRTGQQYLAGLRDGRAVWLDGERVADVTAHPQLARTARTIAALYDLQHKPALQEQMTFSSPTSGDPVALSYLIPQTLDDLLRRRRALEIVAEYSNGMLGRSPDYVNIQVSASAACHAVYGAKEKRFGDNLRAYHEYIREHDLALTHTFGHPQVNRGAAIGAQPDPYIPVGVVDTTADGVIVRGAKLLATLAPFSDELFVPPYRPLQESEAIYALGFAIPTNTPGLSYICRESFDTGRSLYDQPLSGRYEEMDALAVFDDVLIPWERVFAYNDVETHNRIVTHAPMWPQYMQQVAVKDIAKLQFILGITKKVVDAINIGVHAHVQEKVAEIVDTLEMVRALLRAAEADAGPGYGEGIWPAEQPWVVLRHWFPDAYTRVIWIVEQLCASGLMLTPTEADVRGPIGDVIARYYQGASTDAEARIQLFRLAWDLTGTQFGSRQALYERFFNGDIVRLRQGRYHTYDYGPAVAMVDEFLKRVAADEPALTPDLSPVGTGEGSTD
ncbi:MAG: 4-hydroxyphenylacetate 3-monooxygenase, oxygenase component [Geminicoccaceae bacterium]